MRVIKSSFHLISSPLSNISNQSLQKGIFPDKLKIAKVIPVYKSEDPCLFVNYRPISLLSNFSTIFERFMYNLSNRGVFRASVAPYKHEGESGEFRQLCVSGLHNCREFSQLPRVLR